jgi:translation initiation factor 4E
MAAEIEGSIQQEPMSDGMEAAVLSKTPHKLERRWTFWFDNQSKPKQGAAWGSSLRNIYTFDTVEEFWR